MSRMLSTLLMALEIVSWDVPKHQLGFVASCFLAGRVW